MACSKPSVFRSCAPSGQSAERGAPAPGGGFRAAVAPLPSAPHASRAGVKSNNQASRVISGTAQDGAATPPSSARAPSRGRSAAREASIKASNDATSARILELLQQNSTGMSLEKMHSAMQGSEVKEPRELSSVLAKLVLEGRVEEKGGSFTFARKQPDPRRSPPPARLQPLGPAKTAGPSVKATHGLGKLALAGAAAGSAAAPGTVVPPPPAAAASAPAAAAGDNSDDEGAAGELSRTDRMRLVAKRTHALRKLRKEFEAGAMSPLAFADAAAAIEGEFAALLGPPGGKAPQPAARGSRSPSRAQSEDGEGAQPNLKRSISPAAASAAAARPAVAAPGAAGKSAAPAPSRSPSAASPPPVGAASPAAAARAAAAPAQSPAPAFPKGMSGILSGASKDAAPPGPAASAAAPVSASEARSVLSKLKRGPTPGAPTLGGDAKGPGATGLGPVFKAMPPPDLLEALNSGSDAFASVSPSRARASRDKSSPAPVRPGRVGAAADRSSPPVVRSRGSAPPPPAAPAAAEEEQEQEEAEEVSTAKPTEAAPAAAAAAPARDKSSPAPVRPLKSTSPPAVGTARSKASPAPVQPVGGAAAEAEAAAAPARDKSSPAPVRPLKGASPPAVPGARDRTSPPPVRAAEPGVVASAAAAPAAPAKDKSSPAPVRAVKGAAPPSPTPARMPSPTAARAPSPTAVRGMSGVDLRDAKAAPAEVKLQAEEEKEEVVVEKVVKPKQAAAAPAVEAPAAPAPPALRDQPSPQPARPTGPAQLSSKSSTVARSPSPAAKQGAASGPASASSATTPAARSPSPSSLTSGLSGISKELLQTTVNPRDMRRKLLLLRGMMNEVQGVVKTLEAKREMYEARPPEQRERYYVELEKARAVLAQVRATLASCGELPDEEGASGPTAAAAAGAARTLPGKGVAAPAVGSRGAASGAAMFMSDDEPTDEELAEIERLGEAWAAGQDDEDDGGVAAALDEEVDFDAEGMPVLRAGPAAGAAKPAAPAAAPKVQPPAAAAKVQPAAPAPAPAVARKVEPPAAAPKAQATPAPAPAPAPVAPPKAVEPPAAKAKQAPAPAPPPKAPEVVAPKAAPAAAEPARPVVADASAGPATSKQAKGVQDDELAALADLLQYELEEREVAQSMSKQEVTKHAPAPAPPAPEPPKAQAPPAVSAPPPAPAVQPAARQPTPSQKREPTPTAKRQPTPSLQRDAAAAAVSKPPAAAAAPAPAPAVQQRREPVPEPPRPAAVQPSAAAAAPTPAPPAVQRDSRLDAPRPSFTQQPPATPAPQPYVPPPPAEDPLFSAAKAGLGSPTQVNLPPSAGTPTHRATPKRSRSPSPDKTPSPSRSADEAKAAARRKRSASPQRPTPWTSDLGFTVAAAEAYEAALAAEEHASMIYWDPEPSSRARDAGQGGEPGQPGDGYGLETQVLVQMSLPYRVAFGEVIKVAGSGPEFGEWSVDAARLMAWTEGDVWVTEMVLPPGRYEVKAVVRNTVTKDVRWEGGYNKMLEVPSKLGTLRVKMLWGEQELQAKFEEAPDDAWIPVPLKAREIAALQNQPSKEKEKAKQEAAEAAKEKKEKKERSPSEKKMTAAQRLAQEQEDDKQAELLAMESQQLMQSLRAGSQPPEDHPVAEAVAESAAPSKEKAGKDKKARGKGAPEPAPFDGPSSIMSAWGSLSTGPAPAQSKGAANVYKLPPVGKAAAIELPAANVWDQLLQPGPSPEELAAQKRQEEERRREQERQQALALQRKQEEERRRQEEQRRKEEEKRKEEERRQLLIAKKKEEEEERKRLEEEKRLQALALQKKQEEEKRRLEEEKRQQALALQRKQEEERRRQEEERKRQEEEKRLQALALQRKQEEEKRKQEEERRRQEDERKRQEELRKEEERRQQLALAAQKKQEEERKRQEEQRRKEEEQRQQVLAAQKKKQEEEEAQRKEQERQQAVQSASAKPSSWLVSDWDLEQDMLTEQPAAFLDPLPYSELYEEEGQAAGQAGTSPLRLPTAQPGKPSAGAEQPVLGYTPITDAAAAEAMARVRAAAEQAAQARADADAARRAEAMAQAAEREAAKSREKALREAEAARRKADLVASVAADREAAEQLLAGVSDDEEAGSELGRVASSSSTSEEEDSDDLSQDPGRVWRQQVASKMLSELKKLANEMAAGAITREEYEQLTAQLRLDWDNTILHGAPDDASAAAAAAAPESRTSSAADNGVLHHDQQPQHEYQASGVEEAILHSGQYSSVMDTHDTGFSDVGYSPFGGIDDGYDLGASSSGISGDLGYEEPEPEPAINFAGTGLTFLLSHRTTFGHDDTDIGRGGVPEPDSFVITSPHGYPVPPEFDQLRPGKIFSMEVLKAALFHSGVLDSVPPGSLDGGWNPWARPRRNRGWGSTGPVAAPAGAMGTRSATAPATIPAPAQSGSHSHGSNNGVVHQQREPAPEPVYATAAAPYSARETALHVWEDLGHQEAGKWMFNGLAPHSAGAYTFPHNTKSSLGETMSRNISELWQHLAEPTPEGAIAESAGYEDAAYGYASSNGNGVAAAHAEPAVQAEEELEVAVQAGDETADYLEYAEPEIYEGQVLVKLSMPYIAGSDEVVRFVGGRAEFGSWTPEAAPVFNWSRGDLWLADIPLWPGRYQFKPVIWNTVTGEASWEPGPMRTLIVPDHPGGSTLTLNCSWSDFEMEAKFYCKSEADPEGAPLEVQTIRMETSMVIE